MKNKTIHDSLTYMLENANIVHESTIKISRPYGKVEFQYSCSNVRHTIETLYTHIYWFTAPNAWHTAIASSQSDR